MTVATKFVKLLQSSIDPEVYSQIIATAQEQTKTLQDTIMEVAKTVLTPEAYLTLENEAKYREEQSALSLAANTKEDKPPVKPNVIAAPVDLKTKATHAQVRLNERYNMTITASDIADMIKMIKAREQNVKLIKQSTIFRIQYEILWQGRRVNVIYSPADSRIITALPIAEPKKTLRTGKKSRGNPRSQNYDTEDLH